MLVGGRRSRRRRCGAVRRGDEVGQPCHSVFNICGTIALVLTSPALNATTTLSGGFFEVGPPAALVYLTVKDAEGATLSHRALFGGRAALGNLSFVFKRAHEAPGLPPPLELLFEKVPPKQSRAQLN